MPRGVRRGLFFELQEAVEHEVLAVPARGAVSDQLLGLHLSLQLQAPELFITDTACTVLRDRIVHIVEHIDRCRR